jgi:hypothetical protein
MKKIKNFSSWCISKTRDAYKAITMLVEKGHSVLAIGQNAEKLLE